MPNVDVAGEDRRAADDHRVSDERPAGGLLRSNLVVATGTALSRLTGLARVQVLGAVLGQGALADVYGNANNSPNAVYELLIGGVLSAGLVPVFTRHLEADDEDSTSAVISTVIVVLLGLTALSILLAPWIFGASAKSVSKPVSESDFRMVGASLTRIFLIQILFYGVFALWAAVLNARRKFFAPAWAPVLANVVTIAGLVWAAGRLAHGVNPLDAAVRDQTLRMRLGIGATLGIAAMTLALIPALRRSGARLRFRPNFAHPAVRTVFKLSVWTFGYAAANVITVVVIKNLAGAGSGGQTAYTNAFTIFQLPYGLLAVSLTTTMLPELSRRVARHDRDGFNDHAGRGVRMVALLSFPCAALLVALRRSITTVLLQYGRLTAADALVTSRALAGFAIGLVGFSVYLFVLRCFYAHSDTRTPFVINLFECALNIVLAIVLVDRYGVLGLGLAFGLAYLVCALWALQVLSYKVPGFPLRSILVSMGRMLLAATLATELAWIGAHLFGGSGRLGAVIDVVTGSLVGAAAYGAILRMLGGGELDGLIDLVGRRAKTTEAHG